MKNHGLRRIFSLFLALFMVFTLLPTTALAEDTTGADETQPKTVAVDGDEKKTDPPAQEQPKNENPPAPEEPKTFTVTYTDGVGGAVFDNEVHSNLPSGTATPAFSGSLAREGYTFVGWNPAVAETVTADVTYAAKWEAGKTNARRVTVPPIPDPGVAPAALNTGHKIDVRFTVLYVGDEFNIGYNYGSSEKTQFVCQYKTNHSDTAYNNHTIAISDIKAAAGRASVNSGYQIVGWSKESNANPTTWSLNKSGTTACNKGTTIYLVAKNPNPTTKYTYTLNYDANGGTGAPSADSWSTTDAAIRYHSFTVKNTVPTREGYVFKGWKAKDGSDTIYTGGALCSVSQQGNDVVKNGNTWTRTLYAVWEEDAPAQPTPLDEAGVKALLGENAVQIICTNAQIGHGSKTFGLIDGTFTVHQSNNRCEVVINGFSSYMSEFDAVVSVPAGTHITDNSMAGQNRAKINLVWSDGKWTAADAPAKYHVLCSSQPAEPTAPGEGDLENIEKLVRIVCDRNIHDAKEYGVIAGSCEFGGIDVTGDVPTCPVTIRAAKYVEAYNGTIGVEHAITGDTERLLILAWDANNNVWRPMTDTPVTFTVVCPPAKPGAEDLAKLEAPVEVACTTKPETHAAAHFSLGDGTYTIGDVAGNKTDGYTCDITVTADKYVARYNMDYGKHTLTGDNTKTLTLKYVEGQWAVDTPITFPVECEEDLFPVHLVIYRNGNTTTAYKDIALESQPKGHVIDLSTIDIADYYTGNYEFYGWYDDGLFNIYKSDPANPPAGLKEKTVNGWTNLKCMVYDKYQVVYFQSEEALRDFQNDHSKTEGRLYSTTALFGSTLPTADAPTPTRTGYTFKFWSREGQNGDVTGQTVNGWTNLYAVWEKNTYTVTYTDGVNGEAFADQAYTAKYEDATPAFEGTPTRAGYKFLGWEPTVAETVTENATYVAQWEKLYTVTYTDGVGEKAFKDDVHSDLEKDTPTPAFSGGTPTRKGFVFDGWTPEVAETVTDNATYTAQWKPIQPDKKAIEGAIGRGVAVVCDNQNVKHGAKAYKVTLGEYTVSNVMGTAADGYTCTVTVRAAKFIEKYSSDMGDAVHTLIAGEPAEKTIELKWNGEKWVAETELPVTFHTLCPPEQPSKKDIEGAIGRGVKIVCDNQNVNHWGKDYKPTQGEYTVSDVTGTASEGYTCTITVKAAKIIEKYSSDMGKTHALIVGEQAEKTVELKWDGEKWVAKTELPITFHVECPPEKPTYDELKGLGINAKVDCTTTTAHNGKSYTLIEGTYEVSDPERKGTAYTCILTVNAKDYVAKYNAEENVGPHTLDDRDSKTIELTWNGEKWTAAETSVTFNVKCELLTVTYTDGVKGEEVFADVVYKDIPYGTSTPAFGTKDPTRKGYKFVGWEPEVAETVTKDVTYTAKWEELYTVTYTDGVKGKAFKDQVYSDLEAGTDTPKFDGKPTRKGYTFTGWSPKVTDTVTKDVTYVAQWKSVKNGKDNIPKTGDSEIVMVLGSVLLFSFCGAAAVSVYDRKRKHF
ncbi:MAG: InlB B-repeat-containing protein [Oscillospiraceae bacterium]